MLPVVAIIGRPNVGKSTLFNELTRSREALVLDMPGVTRDRLYGEGKVGESPFIVIDTGGLQTTNQTFDILISDQSWQAVEESDVVLFLVDGREGLTSTDHTIAQRLRETKRTINVVVNKTDGLDPNIAIADFFALGLGEPFPIAASHGRGISALVERVLAHYQLSETNRKEKSGLEGVKDDIEGVEGEDKKGLEKFAEAEELAISEGLNLEKKDVFKKVKTVKTLKQASRIKIAIVGRPNVGKSTLVNRMLGEQRVIAFNEPGTTRDSIYIPLERQGEKYTIIDTAGLRRKSRITETIEKFSIVKTLKAIEDCHVVILICDAKDNISEQDLSLLGFVIEAGKALVIAVNKWDGLDLDHKNEVKKKLNYKLSFANFAKIHFISALHGTGVGNLFSSIQNAYLSATKTLSTSELTRILQKAVSEHAPPRVSTRRIKLRYAHAGGHNPPIIVIHGNQTDNVPKSYTRYLMNFFRKRLKMEGTPIRIEYKTGENPYKDKRNTLTPLQKYKLKKKR